MAQRLCACPYAQPLHTRHGMRVLALSAALRSPQGYGSHPPPRSADVPVWTDHTIPPSPPLLVQRRIFCNRALNMKHITVWVGARKEGGEDGEERTRAGGGDVGVCPTRCGRGQGAAPPHLEERAGERGGQDPAAVQGNEGQVVCGWTREDDPAVAS